jgi:hypothetical protein
MKDFAIRLTDRPGELARADMLARYGVNLKSVAALAIASEASVHLLDETEPARAALTKNNSPSRKAALSPCCWRIAPASLRGSAPALRRRA